MSEVDPRFPGQVFSKSEAEALTLDPDDSDDPVEEDLEAPGTMRGYRRRRVVDVYLPGD